VGESLAVRKGEVADLVKPSDLDLRLWSC